MSFNRNIPLLIAATVGVMSGYYIWEPMFKKYQRESKGTWDYKVVQETRAAEMKNQADAIAAGYTNTPAPSNTTGAPSANATAPTTPEAATLASKDKET
ncbi:hypothetical protein BGZ83_000389 [Gryganskiella cystojenkinii]|nr:hypothetical protein BGZ83_000389 [Gryganskiella cystojenkinii]